MGKTPVTQKQWRDIMGNNPSLFQGNDSNPVEQVSWNDVQEFLKVLNKKTGLTFRLPTEAEWEFAARGGNKSKGYKYSGSNNLDEVAWYDKNPYDLGEKHKNYGTNPVAQKKPNELGLYDMSGNVREWCNDWYGTYPSGSQKNPTGAATGSNRVSRGGSWNSRAGICRSAHRDSDSPGIRISSLGFRLVRSY